MRYGPPEWRAPGLHLVAARLCVPGDMADGAGRASTLLISPWTPYPLVFGGAIRVYYLIKMLATFSDVTLVAFRSWTRRPRRDRAPRDDLQRVVLVDGKPEQTAGCGSDRRSAGARSSTTLTTGGDAAPDRRRGRLDDVRQRRRDAHADGLLRPAAVRRRCACSTCTTSSTSCCSVGRRSNGRWPSGQGCGSRAGSSGARSCGCAGRSTSC